VSDFVDLVDLANERLGGSVLAANDEFFAPKENLLREAEAVFKPDLYTDRGKWMDGWETRRRRVPGHDWCLVRLGLPGIVRGAVVDTRHFRGNFPESFSLEGAELPADPPFDVGEGTPAWHELVARSTLAGDSINEFPVSGSPRVTHLILRIYPDGGVARLRVYGDVVPDPRRLARMEVFDLAAVENGGRVLDASDMFFGHRHHLIYPGPSQGMFDGWETRRRRGTGHDWVVVALARPGRLRWVEVDTTHFKGNAPAACSLEACTSSAWESGHPDWEEILVRQPLHPHARHEFATELAPHGAISHVRFHIYPDGGVARLRLFGAPEAAE
jgi:allantoicase